MLTVLPPEDAVLDAAGPSQATGPAIYLFQSYDCAGCWNATLSGGTQELIDAAQAHGASLVWKNVAPERPHAAIAAHCVWQQFPERWVEWNHAAFEQQLEAGAGWATMDRILYMTETQFLLPRAETAQFEACLTSGDFEDQVHQDTRFWSSKTLLPALYADGEWHDATPEAIERIQASR